MAAARRVGNSLRCGVHCCDHALGTIEHGPILRDGSEAVNLILARGFRPDADGRFRLTALGSGGKGPAQDVWAIRRGGLRVALAPFGPQALVVCPGCRTETIVDLAGLALTMLSPDPPRRRIRGRFRSGVELAFPEFGLVQRKPTD